MLVKMGRAGPPLSHAAGRRQASLGTPVPRMPTVPIDGFKQSTSLEGSIIGKVRIIRHKPNYY